MTLEHSQATVPRAAVVLDPYPLCQEGVRGVLAPLGIDVVGAARTPAAALALVRTHTPDLFVAEIETEDGPAEGVSCIRAACERHCDLAVIVLSARNDPALVAAATVAGAAAYLPKTADSAEIAAEVRRVLSPSIYLVSGESAPGDPDGAVIGRRTVPVRTDEHAVVRLTRRELEVLQLVEGRSNREVARLLWVTDETVKFHLANVYRKLGVSSRAEAVAFARRAGLLDADAALEDERLAGVRLPVGGAWRA